MNHSALSTEPLYLFLHQYKTAGKTLAANVVLNMPWRSIIPLWAGYMGLDPTKRVGHPANPGWVREPALEYIKMRATPETRILMGHMLYPGVHELVPTTRPAHYFTFLRHPVERVVSLYFYQKYNSTNYWHSELVESNWSLDEWLEKSRALWAHNGQTRHLLLGMHELECLERELDPKLLRHAKKYLDHFWFIGLTENFPNDTAYLYGKWRFYKFAEERAINVTNRKDALSSKTYDLIAAYNKMDLELYEHALHLRQQFFLTQSHHYYWNIMRARVRQFKHRRRQ